MSVEQSVVVIRLRQWDKVSLSDHRVDFICDKNNFEVDALIAVIAKMTLKLLDWIALLAGWLLTRGDLPIVDRDALYSSELQ